MQQTTLLRDEEAAKKLACTKLELEKKMKAEGAAKADLLERIEKKTT